LSKEYQEDENFRLSIRKILSLPFVPVEDVVEAFHSIEGDFEDDAESLIQYFEKTWVGEKKKRGKHF
jgi:hypothetical protein